MTNDQKRIYELQVKLQSLVKKQDSFAADIKHLKFELEQLKTSINTSETETEKTSLVEQPIQSIKEEKEVISQPQPTFSKNQITVPKEVKEPAKPKGKSDLEKFIGENLINKIGILILIIGIGIGGKYSIENDLISPVTRIVLGYLSSFGLLGFGIKLKKKYTNYSAILVSGAIAVMYFMTYMAHSLYGLIPISVTFVMMVIFTIFTTITSLHYNKQALAIIGLVGAYAVPFLLSTGKGNANVFFSYVAVINIGMLLLAFKKYWTLLQKSSFCITWFIFLYWIFGGGNFEAKVVTASTFLILYFLTFYIAFLAYKLLHKEQFEKTDIFLILCNAFIFYGVGFGIIEKNEADGYLGLYTLLNASIHFGVGYLLYTKKEVDKNVFHLAMALVLIFITIAIPVQFDGNGVTLLWVGEATILFWIGRSKKIYFYEKLSYPLMLLAFISIFEDYEATYGHYYEKNDDLRINFLLNVQFLSSVLFIAGFSFINFIHIKTLSQKVNSSKNFLSKAVTIGIPAILIIVSYMAVVLEIQNYWDQLYVDSKIVLSEGKTVRNYDLKKFADVWIINYTVLFGIIISFVNYFKVKSKVLTYFNLSVVFFSIFFFLFIGLQELGSLRAHYISQYNGEYYNIGIMNIAIRYVSIALVGISLFILNRNLNFVDKKTAYIKIYDSLMYFTVLCILSNELIHWMDLSESTQSDKLGLSILWGIYALTVVGIGIWKKKKHIRIGAIVLFGITLFKLFFYDIVHLNTIAKTIVFVSLGVLLLIISFLYNKFKTNISNENNDE
ncbi:DUF2339 domain-containing protein [Flammeovirga sp. SJP92]|uniref:DUF2339 domain-containing protein n=1 Tax=Flammeovirga sp. SJP92 TaxID=1775430 RepID=UPI0007874FFB|nr:DUF2339 domain-containing protein [Flammeovirga sp. SJP92]KXX71082.1 hypothetical protein AVL50_10800 [Flammeovirga sp. SJP92]